MRGSHCRALGPGRGVSRTDLTAENPQVVPANAPMV